MAARGGASPDPKHAQMSFAWTPTTPVKQDSTTQNLIWGNWQPNDPSVPYCPLPRQNTKCQALPACYIPADSIVDNWQSANFKKWKESQLASNERRGQFCQKLKEIPMKDAVNLSNQMAIDLHQETIGAGSNIGSVPTGVNSVQYRAPLDLNSPPRTSTDADFCNLSSLQSKPITPSKNNKGKYLQEFPTGKDTKNNTKGDKVTELHGNKGRLNQVIIETPGQRARRRKHRPRVIIESQKKKSIFKSRAKTPSVPQETAKVKRRCVRGKGATNPSVGEINGIGLNNKKVSSTYDPKGKRKYTREGGNKSGVDLDKETTIATEVAAPQRPRRSCRKSLNFNSDYQVGDKSSSCSMNQPQENIPSSMDPLKDNIRFGGNQTLHTREKCQIVFTNVTHDKETSSVQVRMNPDNQRRPKSSGGSICSSACLTPERQVSILKRQNMGTSVESEICNQNEAETFNNFMHACFLILSQNADGNNGSPGFYFPTIYKKQRTEKGHDMVASSSLQTGATPENQVRHDIHSLSGSFTSQIESVKNQEFASGQCQATDLPRTNPEIDGIQSGRKIFEDPLALGPTEKIRKRKSKGLTELRDSASKLNVCGRLPASTSKVVTTSCLRPNVSVLHEPPTCMEALAANTNATRATMKRSKRRILKNSAVPNLCNHQKSGTTSNGPPLAPTSTYMPTVDSIVEKHSQLDLEQLALVPYQGSGVVVPFDGSFAKVRRRITRPEVDLNEETTRVWRLLLENINSEGIDGTDEVKKKWWENERKVFNGRADSFIARMHLVQGDRRFSQWKGSVLDSLVGVFLTQNVSDHFSSSAFMSMAARFPLKSKTQPGREAEDKLSSHTPEISSQNSSGYSIAQTTEIDGSCLPSTSEEEPTTSADTNRFHNCTPFVKPLNIDGAVLHGVYKSSGKTSSDENQQIQSERLVPDLPNEGHLNNSSKEGPGNYRATTTHDPIAKAGSSRKEKEKQNDWDHMRKQTLINGAERARTANTKDSVDWDAVRCANVSEIAQTIKGRGMNNRLAERIQGFLNRIFKDHGSIDLEWLRDVPPEKAKEYLLSIRGLGLKSVECLRLLTLHHLAFPVDTNVCRIAVRLGWVPLQPLPESLQLHLLELYPILESIQKYLWPRLCKLDQKTLYELHYQMITFGKVFCTKKKPNCNACPMRGECRHFASAFASARLALPAPEEKGIIGATENREVYPIPLRKNNNLQLPPPEVNKLIGKYEGSNSQPLIEEPPSPEPIYEVPATPEQVYAEVSQCDIESAFNEDPDEIPIIQLNMGEFAHNLQEIMQQNTELYEGDMSKALVALTSEAASIPVPKLKNVNRLRTEHRVYELPDSHYLLEGMDKREPDDPCPYLLAIWTPGETSNSIEPPERRCNSHELEKLCTNETCSSCNSMRETDSQTVRGTLLIPCRTAMRGSFPLNGTYFQVNEVFSDHESSVSPINVPRQWLWNLRRRTVYFGTSTSTIFRGMTTEGIQYCFRRGFVCVRGFDRKTRAPRPLIARLHLPASKLVKGKGKEDEK